MKKTALFILLFGSVYSFAETNWCDRVDYYFKRPVDRTLYSIEDSGGKTNIGLWDSRIGPKPTIQQLLIADNATIAKYASDLAVSNQAGRVFSSNTALKIWQTVYNKRNPTNQITDAELYIAATNQIKKSKDTSP